MTLVIPHLRSARRLALGRLLLAVAIAVLAAVFVWLNAPAPLRVPLGVVAVLVLPGYCLSLLAFPPGPSVGEAERLGLSLGLSVALVGVVAICLQYTRWGVRPAPLVIAITAATILWATLAAVREWTQPPAPADAASLIPATSRMRWRSRSALLVTALVGATLVGAGAVAVAVPQPASQASEFYLLGPEGLAENFPRQAFAGRPVPITVGVRNRDTSPLTFEVVVRSSTEDVARYGPSTCDAGAVCEHGLSFAAPHAGDNQPITFQLFRLNETVPFRTLRLWLDVKP